MEVDVENLEELARDLWKSDPRLVISTESEMDLRGRQSGGKAVEGGHRLCGQRDLT